MSGFFPISGGGTGQFQLIRNILLTGSSPNFDFTSIPSTFLNLVLAFMIRDDSVGVGLTAPVITFNGDSGANYDFQYFEGQAAASAAAESFAANNAGVGLEITGGSPAGLFAVNNYMIPNYANTNVNKAIVGESGSKFGTATGNMRVRCATGWWRNNAAINRITMTPGSGSNFVSGCQCTLYGT